MGKWSKHVLTSTRGTYRALFFYLPYLLHKEQQMVTKGTDSAYQHTVDRITPAHKEQAKGEVTACCASRKDF